MRLDESLSDFSYPYAAIRIVRRSFLSTFVVLPERLLMSFYCHRAYKGRTTAEHSGEQLYRGTAYVCKVYNRVGAEQLTGEAFVLVHYSRS